MDQNPSRGEGECKKHKEIKPNPGEIKPNPDPERVKILEDNSRILMILVRIRNRKSLVAHNPGILVILVIPSFLDSS